MTHKKMVHRSTEQAEIVREKGTNRSKFFRGQIDKYTTKESERLLRLPMHCFLSSEQVEYITDKINQFYRG